MKVIVALVCALLLTAQAPPPGTVTIEPAIGDVSDATARVFTEAVQDALTDARFVPVRPPGRGRYTARLRVTREERGLVASTEPRWRSSGSASGRRPRC